MDYKFLLNKTNFSINNSNGFLNSYENTVELPIENHPGSFGYIRKNHIHEGIDFYCEKGDVVSSLANGKVILIKQFTGEKVGSPWWNDTFMILIQHRDFVANYGEINVLDSLKIGSEVKIGETLGYVSTVLKKDKGRPMNMVHFEMYTSGTNNSINSWNLENKKPEELINPTEFFYNNFFKPLTLKKIKGII